MVFGICVLHDLEGHGDISVSSAIDARSLPGGAHGQDLGLVQGDIAQSLTPCGELELFLFLLFLVFGHRERLWADMGSLLL